MDNFSVIIIDNGFPPSLPGFLEDTAASVFPFWGNFILFDFSMNNFAHKNFTDTYTVINKQFKRIVPFLSSRWKNQIRHILVPEKEKEDILAFIKQISSKDLIISFLPHAALFNPEELIDAFVNNKNECLKVSINKTPLPIYYVKKKRMSEIIRNISYNESDQENFYDHILKKLTIECSEIIRIPGEVFFHNTIIQLYHSNLWLIQNLQNTMFLKLLSTVSERMPEGKNAYVSEHGVIKNSVLSQGVEIKGYVENSIIFPKVIINRKSHVVDSIIMNNNVIGRNTTIQNTIILPYIEESTANNHNIGDNAKIGGKTSIMKNKDFPDQIFNGLTLLGFNTIIPRGFRVEQSSYLGPHISLKELKELKILKKGISLYK